MKLLIVEEPEQVGFVSQVDNKGFRKYCLCLFKQKITPALLPQG